MDAWIIYYCFKRAHFIFYEAQLSLTDLVITAGHSPKPLNQQSLSV